jgi:hypothetical protein
MIATYHPAPAAQGAFREISRPPSFPSGVTIFALFDRIVLTVVIPF